MPKRILVLEPFGGGSHAALYRGWRKYSEHQLTILELPAVHWKWRSRHASLTLAEHANALVRNGSEFDVVFCSDMLNLPEWRGFAGPKLRNLPALAYFHENQFTYPIAEGQQRDYQYAYSNVLTVIAAEKVCFNSEFHRQEFASAALQWLRRMPDFRHIDLLEAALQRSEVLPMGVEPLEVATDSDLLADDHELQSIGWVARWEFDKRPDVFVNAMERLIERGCEFHMILLGQQFTARPGSLTRLLEVAGERVIHCGYAEDQASYWQWLKRMDIVVSTADHEFFGVGVIEAAMAGARPVLPNRLAYPEVFATKDGQAGGAIFYDCLEELVDQLQELLRKKPVPTTWSRELQSICWSQLYKRYDASIETIC